MKRYIFIASVVAITASCNSNNPEKQAEKANNAKIDSTSSNTAQANMAKNDADFLVFASNVGTFEIGAAKLAEKNSTNKGVKDFAGMMIKDHTEMGNKVTALATQKNVTLPTALSTDLQNEWNKLDSLKGKKFDEEYVDANVKGHTEAISKFETAANGTDYSPEVKQLAATALPQLNEHKQHAETLQQNEKGNKKGS